MADPSTSLLEDLAVLSVAYSLSVSDDYRWVTVHDYRLPPGFNIYATDVLVEIPSQYPTSPPGVGGSHIYLDPSLRFRERRLSDIHEAVTPGWGNWAWFCYEWIRWDPNRDDLMGFLEMVRADLTNPKTE